MEKMKIKVKAFDHKLVDSAALKLTLALKEANAKVSGPVPLPTRREVFTILRSVHVNKPSREQFESRTHQRLIVVSKPTAALVDKIKRIDMPTGVKVVIETK